MKILITLLLAFFSLAPRLALADAGGASQGYLDSECFSVNCQCKTIGYYGGNIWGRNPDVKTDAECQALCDDKALSAPSLYVTPEETRANFFGEFQCLSDSGLVVKIIREPLPTTPVKDPLLPELNVKIPGLCDENGVCWKGALNNIDDGVYTSNLLGSYIKAVYAYLLIAGSIIAVTMIMIGGLQYAASGGNSQQVEKAKKRIGNAVAGVILLLLAYNIAFLINPATTTFESLSLRTVPKLPVENQFSPLGNDAISCTSSGKDLYGVNTFQDCMLKTYGSSETEVKLVNIAYRGRDYQVNALAADDFKAAFAAIDASGVDYDITADPAGGTYNWRCNKNSPKALSPHSWGTAIDINPAQNPNCPVGCQDTDAATSCTCVSEPACVQQCQTKTYDLPQEVIDAFENNGFAWGGDWTRAVDYMHFTYARGCGGG